MLVIAFVTRQKRDHPRRQNDFQDYEVLVPVQVLLHRLLEARQNLKSMQTTGSAREQQRQPTTVVTTMSYRTEVPLILQNLILVVIPPMAIAPTAKKHSVLQIEIEAHLHKTRRYWKKTLCTDRDEKRSRPS